MNKVNKKSTTVFFSPSSPLWQSVYAWSTDKESTQQDILDPFCPVPWQTTLSLQRCQATFSSCHSKPDPSKTNFPSCCHGSSKYGNGVLLCWGPRLRVHTTAWQSVGLCGRIKHASRSLYSFLNHQRQLCTVADKKEVKLMESEQVGWELKVLSVGLKRKKRHHIFSAAPPWNPSICHC